MKPPHDAHVARCAPLCRVAKKHQQNPILVDLVGEENTGKLADTITLLVMQCDERTKKSALVDLLSVHAAGEALLLQCVLVCACDR